MANGNGMTKEQAVKRADYLEKRLARVKDEAQKAGTAAVRTGAGAVSAFGVSYIETRYPDRSRVFGMDVSLLVGIAATGAGAFGWAGDEDTSRLVEAVGNGALFAFSAKKGAKMGAEDRAKKKS